MPLKLGRNSSGGRLGFEKLYTAHIKLLDNTIIDINIPHQSSGRDCIDKVAQLLGLQEIDYFGLQYLNRKEKIQWVDLDKNLRKQLRRHAGSYGSSMLLQFKVQFWVDSVRFLQQEITRYLYYLHLKNLVLGGHLTCTLDIALRLAGYAVQGELGDYDETKYSAEFLADFVLVPENLTIGRDIGLLANLVCEEYKRHRGLTPAASEVAYITECLKLDDYGTEFHRVKDKDGQEIEIGASYVGFRIRPIGKPVTKCYHWPDIGNMGFNRSTFSVEIIKSGETVQFEVEDFGASKYIWKRFVAQHQFYRLNHSTLRKTTFKTQHEMLADASVLAKYQQTPTIKRRVTLTKRRAKAKQRSAGSAGSKSQSPKVRRRSSAIANGDSPLVHDSLDEKDFFRNYGDVVNRLTNGAASQGSVPSRGSTPASSGYNTSDSDSEFDPNQLSQQAEAVPNGTPGFRPVSLIFTRLKNMEASQRDMLLRHFECVMEEVDLAAEFEQIFTKKQNANFSTALLPENASRNRSKEYLPYEDNRIRLDSHLNASRTDYINASKIRLNITAQHQISFIAAESPLANTVDNWWHMIWENDITVIVMVGKLEENQKSVCCPYWPDAHNNQNITAFGLVTVRMNFASKSPSYTIRSFNVHHRSGEKDRTVFHLHFTHWPEEEDATPKRTHDFIAFLDEMHSLRIVARDVNMHMESSQTLVHCNTGVGRTGVVILCEYVLSLIEHNENVDVPISLATMRAQRAHLVLTAEQYKFVYTVMVGHLKRNRLI